MNAGKDVWMIGDNPVADIAGAQAVGMRAILVGSDISLNQAATQVADAGH